MRTLVLALAITSTVCAGPIVFSMSGTFGQANGTPTVLDNQDYFINFVIPDPHSPARVFDNPIAQIGATYPVIAQLAIPGLNFVTQNLIEAGYNSQQPLGLWLNLSTFTGLPVGDFMVATPVQVFGTPLWNGVAGALGTPELNVFTNAPAHARFFIEQNTPNQGAIPIAVYESAAVISQLAPGGGQVPEPGSMATVGAALLGVLMWRRGALNLR